MKIAIVVPAYNEEEGIRSTIERLKKVKAKTRDRTEIIIVNDGSRDNTVAEAKRAGGVRIIDFPKNSGKGAALKKAFNQIDADIIATTDADCTYEVEKIPFMIETLEKERADLVVGSRFLGKIRGGMSPLNWMGNVLFSWMITALTGVPTTDGSSGLRVFNKKAIAALGIQAKGLDYEIEMSVKANKRKLKVVEVPITYEKRAGRSKLNPILDGWRFFKAIVQAYLKG